MGLACVKAQRLSLEDSNDMRQLSPPQIGQESPTESKPTVREQNSDGKPLLSKPERHPESVESEPTVDLDQTTTEEARLCDSVSEGQTEVEDPESQEPIDRKDSGDIEQIEERYSEEGKAQTGPSAAVSGGCDAEPVKEGERILPEAVSSVDNLDDPQQVGAVTIEPDHAHVSLHSDERDSTDGVFESSMSNRESSETEGQRPEGVSADSNDVEELEIVEESQKIVTALDRLDFDLSESMKMRTLRSSSKKHKKAKNRRKRMRAQQFAAVSNTSN